MSAKTAYKPLEAPAAVKQQAGSGPVNPPAGPPAAASTTSLPTLGAPPVRKRRPRSVAPGAVSQTPAKQSLKGKYIGLVSFVTPSGQGIEATPTDYTIEAVGMSARSIVDELMKKGVSGKVLICRVHSQLTASVSTVTVLTPDGERRR